MIIWPTLRRKNITLCPATKTVRVDTEIFQGTYLKSKGRISQSWSPSCETCRCPFKVTFQWSEPSVLIEHGVPTKEKTNLEKLVQNTANRALLSHSATDQFKFCILRFLFVSVSTVRFKSVEYFSSLLEVSSLLRENAWCVKISGIRN